MAIDELNAKGVIIGGTKVKFELVAEDDAADPKQGAMAAKKLCDLKVNGVVGHLNSGTAIPASKIYNDCEIPMISPSVTNPKLTQQGFKNIFRLTANDNALGAGLALFAANDLKLNKVAIIDDRTAYGQGVAEVFKKTAMARGMTIVDEQSTSDKATDFTAILTAIKAKKPDAIFYGGMDTQGGPLLRQMEQFGLTDVKVLGGDGICTAGLVKNSGGAKTLGNVVCAEGGASLAKIQGGSAWKARYDAQYPGQFQAYSPYTYDATMLLADAMVRAGSTDPKIYTPKLFESNYQGVTAKIAFNADGDPKYPAITLYAYETGAKREVASSSSPPPPPPPTTPAPAPTRAPDIGVFWNSWMEHNGVLATSPLTVKMDYTFSIDLARYSYAASSAAGDLIDAEVRNALERNEGTITLYVRPLVIGTAIALGPDAKSGYRVDVSIERLKTPSAALLASDVLTYNRYVSGEVPIGEISSRFRAADLRLPVVASEAGCGHVVLSIWDGTGLRPLDHVVYSAPVGTPNACGPAGESVRAGFSTVVEAAPSAAKPPSRPDVGLLIFDLPQQVGAARGVGVLVDATPLANKAPPAVFYWQLFESTFAYVTDPANLLTLINSDRKKKNYASAAKELRRVIFPPNKNDDGTDGPGEIAFQALQRIARDANHDPLVLARVVSSERRPIYVPLSLLSTTGGSLGGRPIRVVHQAPFPPSSRQPGCVTPWTYAVPASLASYQGEVLSEPDRSWISTNRQATVDSLKTYFGTQTSTAKPSPAEGLLLLAHQSKGNIWFDNEAERLRIGDLTRKFSPGSVAVLSACSVAAADGDNDAWVSHLSRQGVSAIFASPFPVDRDYGVELTRSFIHAVRQAQHLPKDAEAPTIASLFVSASEAAAKQLNIAPLDVQREFVWIGDPDIRLCK